MWLKIDRSVAIYITPSDPDPDPDPILYVLRFRTDDDEELGRRTPRPKRN
jgi:hypothetical protein